MSTNDECQHGTLLRYPCRECKRAEKATELDNLGRFFGEPVLPLSVVCEAVRDWAECSGASEDVRRALGVSIGKSGLMWRMIYQGERPRTEKCPVHQGTMDTGLWVLGGLECCDGSGWLNADTAKREERIAWVAERRKSERWNDIYGWEDKKIAARIAGTYPHSLLTPAKSASHPSGDAVSGVSDGAQTP